MHLLQRFLNSLLLYTAFCSHYNLQVTGVFKVRAYNIGGSAPRTTLQTGNVPYFCLYIAGLSSHTSLYGRKLHDIHSYNRHMLRV